MAKSFQALRAPETLEQARARNIADALAEDFGPRDPTAELAPSRPIEAQLRVREAAVLCGREWFEGCVRALDPNAQFVWAVAEGELTQIDQIVCTIRANSRAMLSAERPAMNLLQTLSGTATAVRRYTEAVAGLSPNPRGCALLDTRKTLPGLRLAQKYAVRVGGGMNQRLALYDGILIKENHIAAAGGVAQAFHAAQALGAGVPIQIEVESLDQMLEALEAGAASLLLDNFSVEQLRQAVVLNADEAERRRRPPALLEASGGLDIEGLREVVATGVDRVSIGALTKHLRAVDYSLRISGWA